MVESVAGEDGPYRSVLFAVHLACIEPFEHFLFTFEIGLALVVYLIEVDTHALVGLVKSGVYPFVHFLPESTDFGVLLFPFHEHFTSLLHERRFCLSLVLGHAFLHEALDLSLEMLVEKDVEVADQMVAFFS